MNPILLKEYESKYFGKDAIDNYVAQQIWELYREKIDVIPPSFQTDDQWILKPKGWIGHIPINQSVSILIRPKLPIGNLFRMLEYAYQIEFAKDDHLVSSDTLHEFYQRLANILAKQVIRRTLKGLYQEYVSHTNMLPFVRGRIDTKLIMDNPSQVELRCHFQVNTQDNEENQILAWTLFCIARTGLCKGEIKHTVGQAYRLIHNFAKLVPVLPEVCTGRQYNRLNSDYKGMHALCRFFLEGTGPFHDSGSKAMLPFLIDMPALYEHFVAEWLKKFLAQYYPGLLRLEKQQSLKIGLDNKVEFRIDMVLENIKTGQPICLMDTKYKIEETPSASDLQQVIAYAKVIGCKHAFLIYPNTPQNPFSATIGGNIHVQAISFGLDGDLEANGRLFFKHFLQYTVLSYVN